MILKQGASLRDYISPPYSNITPDSEERQPPSHSEHFESLELQQEKVLMRQGMLERLLIDLEKLLKTIYYRARKIEKDDKILSKLKGLKQQAIALNFRSIANLIHLAIGKRLAIVEIRREGFDDDQKQSKEFDLRYMRLQTIKFNELQIEKLQKKIFIFEPFINGSGFNYESCLYKSFHSQTLDAVEARATLHEINKIWYRSYTKHKQPKFGVIQEWIKGIARFAIWFMLILSFITYYVLEVPLQPNQNDFMAWLLRAAGTLAPITVFMLLICTIMDVCQPIREDTELRIINQAINQHINRVNRHNQDSLMKRVWKVQADLLWIELRIVGAMVEDETYADPIITMCTEKILNNKVGHTKSFLMNVRGSHLSRANG